MERFKIEKITNDKSIVTKVSFESWEDVINYAKLCIKENIDLIEVKISRINPKCLYRVTVDRK